MTRVIITCIAVKQLAKTVIKLGRPTVFNNQRIDISNALDSYLLSFEVRNNGIDHSRCGLRKLRRLVQRRSRR